MITIVFREKGGGPLYEQLYRALRRRIEAGAFAAGDKLPSKRAMAGHLRVSMRTVENAYAQLEVEGYVEAREKSGYFVRRVELPEPSPEPPPPARTGRARPAERARRAARSGFDLGTENMHVRHFPFTVWTKLMRESLRFESTALLEPVHSQGDPALRLAIARHLRQFRGMRVDADQVVVGAGTEYLLGLVADLLRGSVFALENPNFHKWSKILASRRAAFAAVPMDDEGIGVDVLKASGAGVALVTPSHHFPLGTVMSINRRRQLLSWAGQTADRYIIEDDYDTEYRYALRPAPALHSLDRNDKVVYMNTFTRTLAPSLRVAYMVLPGRLLDRYRNEMNFYSSTVSAFEQDILRRFLDGGFYERHLNRIRTAYKSRRDTFLRELSPLAKDIAIHGHEAGLHFLVTSRRGVGEGELVKRAARRGVTVYGLSGYYLDAAPETGTVVVGYAGYEEEDLVKAGELLVKAWRKLGKER